MSQPATPAAMVFLVEDDPIVRRGSEQALSLAGLEVRCFASAEAASDALALDRPAAIVTDVRLPGRSGLDLMSDVRLLDRDLPVVLVTGHGDVSMAVQAMREGAYDFLEKPFSSERLVGTVRRAVERFVLAGENRALRERLPSGDAVPIIGQSPAMQDLRRQIAALAPSDVDILIHGDTGTGKEVVARTLHALSGRRGPFVALNCAALPESVIESEVFGHEAGAFTGAHRRRIGRFEFASGGTLFLDEVESMPLSIQLKLLRVLQERVIERLGSNTPVAVDCRIIAAAKGDLQKLAESGQFRMDLYYRLNVVALQLPPLNRRRGDIPLLMAHFIQQAAARFRVPMPQWTDQDVLRWQQHPWPGNVRELQNAAERMCLLASDGLAAPDPCNPSLAARLEAIERSWIHEAMVLSGGNVAKAAEMLRIPKKTLYDKLQKTGQRKTRGPA